MIAVKCMQKIRDNNNVIIRYVLQDNNGNIKSFEPNTVKKLIKQKKLSVTNLKLTSDNRLIDVKQEDLTSIMMDSKGNTKQKQSITANALQSDGDVLKVLLDCINNTFDTPVYLAKKIEEKDDAVEYETNEVLRITKPGLPQLFKKQELILTLNIHIFHDINFNEITIAIVEQGVHGLSAERKIQSYFYNKRASDHSMHADYYDSRLYGESYTTLKYRKFDPKGILDKMQADVQMIKTALDTLERDSLIINNRFYNDAKTIKSILSKTHATNPEIKDKLKISIGFSSMYNMMQASIEHGKYRMIFAYTNEEVRSPNRFNSEIRTYREFISDSSAMSTNNTDFYSREIAVVKTTDSTETYSTDPNGGDRHLGIDYSNLGRKQKCNKEEFKTKVIESLNIGIDKLVSTDISKNSSSEMPERLFKDCVELLRDATHNKSVTYKDLGNCWEVVNKVCDLGFDNILAVAIPDYYQYGPNKEMIPKNKKNSLRLALIIDKISDAARIKLKYNDKYVTDLIDKKKADSRVLEYINAIEQELPDFTTYRDTRYTLSRVAKLIRSGDIPNEEAENASIVSNMHEVYREAKLAVDYHSHKKAKMEVHKNGIKLLMQKEIIQLIPVDEAHIAIDIYKVEVGNRFTALYSNSVKKYTDEITVKNLDGVENTYTKDDMNTLLDDRYYDISSGYCKLFLEDLKDILLDTNGSFNKIIEDTREDIAKGGKSLNSTLQLFENRGDIDFIRKCIASVRKANLNGLKEIGEQLAEALDSTLNEKEQIRTLIRQAIKIASSSQDNLANLVVYMNRWLFSKIYKFENNTNRTKLKSHVNRSHWNSVETTLERLLGELLEELEYKTPDINNIFSVVNRPRKSRLYEIIGDFMELE